MSRFDLWQKDAVLWLKTLPSGSVDLMITDPPYESLERYRAIGTTTRLRKSKASNNAWFSIFEDSRFPELFSEVYRVLGNDRHFYLFCDATTMRVAVPGAEARGFTFWKPLVWDKVAIGMGYHYRARYEFILFFEKGKRRLRDLSVPDILREKRIVGGYPTEKPAALIETLILNSSVEGEIVCDPFCGSGSTGVAALRHERDFVGADLADDAIALAAKRLGEIGGHKGVTLTKDRGPQLALPV